jgi:hypothetical protein
VRTGYRECWQKKTGQGVKWQMIRSMSEVSEYTKVHTKYNILISTIYSIQQPFGPMLLDKSAFTVFI